MGIEDRLPKKQKAQGGKSAKGLISIRNGGDRQCRRHHNPLTKTPVWTGILAGAKIRATEAAQTRQVHYPAFGSRDQGRSRNDMPQLFDSMQESRKALGWPTTLSEVDPIVWTKFRRSLDGVAG
jgi:hypothetical protein